MEHKFICPGLEAAGPSDAEIQYGNDLFFNEEQLIKGLFLNQIHTGSLFFQLPLSANLEFLFFHGILSWKNHQYICDTYPFSNLKEAECIFDMEMENIAVFRNMRGETFGDDEKAMIGRDSFWNILITIENAFSLLKQGNHQQIPVLYRVEGPFTILAKLLPFPFILRNMRKNKEKLLALLYQISSFLMAYMKWICNLGVDLISYAEPSADIALLGEKNWKVFVGDINDKLMNDIRSDLGDTKIHLCGKLSVALEATGYLLSRKETFIPATYGKLIYDLICKKDCTRDCQHQILGHACMNCEKKMADHVIWLMKKI